MTYNIQSYWFINRFPIQWKSGFLQIITMELDYKSQANVDISKQLNKLDRLNSRLHLTLKHIPTQQIIPQKLKDKVLKCIVKDNPRQLIRTLDKEVIVWHRELGAKGTHWNVIHLCAKNDAVLCSKVVLKQLYQQDTEQYITAANSETAEGLTPLMVAIIYQSKKVLDLLLSFGGMDLSKIEKGKMRASDLAIHYRNEYAIEKLVRYQKESKCRQYLNLEELQKHESLLEEEPGFCDAFTSYLMDCFICCNFQDNESEIFTNINPFSKPQNKIDIVKVGSRKDIEDYQIEWKKLSNISGQKLTLFNSFHSIKICEGQFSLKNSLIMIQALSDFPWLLRRVISKLDYDQENPQRYRVNLYHNCSLHKVQTDQCIPTIKERGQPMFLSDREEIWPMILQKAMAKMYGSYLSLNNLSPVKALQTITGFYAKEIPIRSLLSEEKGYLSSLEDLVHRKYLIILQARPRTDLNTGPDNACFSLLLIWEKGNIKKLLIGCPGKVDKQDRVQKVRDLKQQRQLLVRKSHFDRPNQSNIWIDEDQLEYYFKSAVLVFIKDEYTRNDLKIKLKLKAQGNQCLDEPTHQQVEGVPEKLEQKQYKKSIFFKYKIESWREQSILLQIADLETRHSYNLTELQGFRIRQGQGMDELSLFQKQPEHQTCPELMRIESLKGEYLCKFELKSSSVHQHKKHSEATKSIIKKKDVEDRKKVKLNLGPDHLHQIQLTTWSPQPLQLELVEEQFGTIEWLAHFREFSNLHWNKLAHKFPFLTETVNMKTIVMAERTQGKRMYLALDCQKSAVLEGKWKRNGDFSYVQMLNEPQQKCGYCVLSGVPSSVLKKAQIVLTEDN